MAHKDGRITAPVSVRDVQQVLGNGSKFVGVLCKSANINPWAKYRPIPCNIGANNTPKIITPAQRLQERYGIEPPVDMFSNDVESQYVNYANGIEKYGQYYLKLRPWRDTHWKRLSDFAKTDNDGTVTKLGYDHNAKPREVEVTIKSGTVTGTFKLQPLIPEDQRTLSIPSGAVCRFEFPNDHLWLNEYYNSVYGAPNANVAEADGNDEWLSPIDLMGTSTYFTNKNFGSVRRRVLIFEKNGGKWQLYNYVTDRDTAGFNQRSRPYSSYPKAWIDFNENTGNVNTYYPAQGGAGTIHTYNYLADMSGTYLFVECWVEDNSSTNVMPIHGFAYEVTIVRGYAADNIDIVGVVEFMNVKLDGDIYLYFRVATASLNQYSNNVLSLLKAYYSALTTITNVNNPNKNATCNLLTYAVSAFNANGTSDGWSNFYVPVGVESDNYEEGDVASWTTTISVTRKEGGTLGTKVFTVQS